MVSSISAPVTSPDCSYTSVALYESQSLRMYTVDVSGNTDVRWNDSITPVADTSTITITMLLRFTNHGTGRNNPSAILRLYAAAGGSPIMVLRSVDTAPADGIWSLIIESSGATPATNTFADAATEGTTYCVKITDDLSTDDVTIWVDEDANGDKAECGTTGGQVADGSQTGLDADYVRFSNTTNLHSDLVIDNVEISW